MTEADDAAQDRLRDERQTLVEGPATRISRPVAEALSRVASAAQPATERERPSSVVSSPPVRVCTRAIASAVKPDRCCT